MRLEIDMPEHHYNNIIAFDSVNLGRVPYKGIIMYAINAIKHGRVLEQEPTTKNLAADIEDAVERLNAIKHLIGYGKDSEIVKVTQKSLDMAIKALEQEPRKGHWNDIPKYKNIAWQCSECEHFTTMKHNYCSNCGAKMGEPQESEDK